MLQLGVGECEWCQRRWRGMCSSSRSAAPFMFESVMHGAERERTRRAVTRRGFRDGRMRGKGSPNGLDWNPNRRQVQTPACLDHRRSSSSPSRPLSALTAGPLQNSFPPHCYCYSEDGTKERDQNDSVLHGLRTKASGKSKAEGTTFRRCSVVASQSDGSSPTRRRGPSSPLVQRKCMQILPVHTLDTR